MKSLLAGLLLFFFSLGAQALPVKLAEVEGVSEYRLDNGLKVLIAPDPSRPTITVNMTYLVGSRHEGYGETGMAHLLEHLLFKGTPGHPDIPQALSRRGMRPNGLTSHDRTQYFETFPASEENLAWALGMEADRMVNSFVADGDLRSEMTVVRNEMESGENNPASVLRQKVLASAYQWHGYGRSVIGARSDVENVRIANLQAFYRTYYQPDNAVLTVAGRIDSERTLGLIEKTFGVIARPSRSLPQLHTVEPPQEGERSVRLERRGENRILQVAYHVPPGAHPDSVALDVFMSIMARTPGGRLHKSLVNSGLATGTGAWGADLFDPGYAFYSVQMRRQDSPEAARRVLLEVLEGGQNVTDDEVEAAKQTLLADYEKILTDTTRLAMALSGAIGQGDWRLFFWQRDRLAAIDAAEVSRVASHYYRPANRTLGEFVPVAEPARVEIPAAPDLGRMLDDYRGRDPLSTGEAFDLSLANVGMRTRQFRLANGMQLALLSKQNRGRTVRATLLLNLGDEASLQGQAEVARLTAAMLMRGTQRASREDIAQELDRLRSRLHLSGHAQQVTASIETVREHLPAVLVLLQQILREPAFPANEFDQLLRQTQAAIESARIEPDSVSSLAMARHFNDWPSDDIRYVKNPDEQLQSLDRVSRDDLRDFHARFYGTASGQFAAVGDFDADELAGQLGKLLGDWSAVMPYQRVQTPFRAAAPVRLDLQTPDKQNAVFRAALRLPVGENHPDYPALRVASHILGGGFISSRLANRLRQQEGISYSVGAGLSASRDEQDGSFTAYAIYAPQFRDKVGTAFIEEMRRAWRDGFTADEVRDAQNAILQAAQLERALDAGLAAMLAADLLHGQDWQRTLAIEERIRTLSDEEVHAAVRKYLDPAGFSLFFAGDFAGKSSISP